MFRAFKVMESNALDSSYLGLGKLSTAATQALIRKNLDKYLKPNGNIDAAALESDWFPEIDTDVFISHAHANEDQAKSLAGFLDKNFGVKSFIDSTVWKYAPDLIRIIDDEVRRLKKSETYNYNDRNASTSHVYLMLATALTKMINRCECLIFIGTPEAISPINSVTANFFSPWIYYELLTAKYMHRIEPERRLQTHSKNQLIAEASAYTYEYKLDISHLETLSIAELQRWRDEMNSRRISTRGINLKGASLDYLYDTIKPLKKSALIG